MKRYELRLNINYLLFILTREISPNNFIPYRRANAETICGILIVMFHVMVFNCKPEFIMHIKMVNSIMGNIIAQITEKKSCHKRGDKDFTYYHIEEQIEENS